jgi:CheY-like chemotaxis protein
VFPFGRGKNYSLFGGQIQVAATVALAILAPRSIYPRVPPGVEKIYKSLIVCCGDIAETILSTLIIVPTNFSSKSFGAKVRVLRDQLGFSQETLAELAGLHRTYVSDVERGARNISLNSINKLAAALQVSAASLLQDVQHILPGKLIEILLVEDDPNDVELTLAALHSVNILNRVHVLVDGAAALDFLLGKGDGKRRAEDRPHLILLDLALPKVDGMEVLRQIKADPRTRSIPVVILTVSSRSKDIAACKRLGAGGYLVKPVGIQNLSEVTPQLSLQWALLTMGSEATA